MCPYLLPLIPKPTKPSVFTGFNMWTMTSLQELSVEECSGVRLHLQVYK